VIHNALVNPFDTKVYHFINGFAGHNHLLDATMVFFAKDALEIYAVLFVIAWFALPKKDIHNRHALVMAGLSGILALIINVVISHIWFRPRPFTVFQKGTYTELVAHSADASFPSDHAAGSFGFAAGSWGRQRKLISYLFTIIAVIVMVARVFVGVHYPTDVIGGMIVGIIASKIVWRFSGALLPVSTFIAKLFHYGPGAKGGKHVRSNVRSRSRSM
jgi:undecaprenyl-diphosphatase